MEENKYSTYIINENSNQPNNDHLDVANIKALACFIIGYLGLSLVATIVQAILTPFVNNDNAMQISSLINFLAYALTTITLLAVLGKEILKKILKQYKNLNNIGKGILYGGILLGSSIFYNLIILLIYPEFGQNQNQNNVLSLITETPIIMFLTVVLLAPITEEITYRLSLAGFISKKNKVLAIIISSLLFGFIHSAFSNSGALSMTKEQLIDEIVALPSYIISGVIMSIAYIKEDSIVCSITAHMTNNLIAFIQPFLITETLLRIF